MTPLQPDAPAPDPTPTAKPFWKKWWVITLAALFVIGGIGSALDGGKNHSPAAPTPWFTQAAPSNLAASPSSPPPAGTTTATFGWDASVVEADSVTACETRGKKDYPYGFKVKSVLGRQANELRPDSQGRFLKYMVTITNANGADYDATMECTVSGDPRSPSVESFFTY